MGGTLRRGSPQQSVKRVPRHDGVEALAQHHRILLPRTQVREPVGEPARERGDTRGQVEGRERCHLIY